MSGVPPPNERRFVPGEIVVQISRAIPSERVVQIARQAGLTLVSSQSFDLAGRVIYRVRSADGRDVGAVIRALERNRIVASAQPNYLFTLAQSTPAVSSSSASTTGAPSAAKLQSDPEVAARTTLPTGDVAQYVIGKLHLAAAHQRARGRNVGIAVIDSEIDGAHPDLVGVVADRFDATSSPSKPDAHGTGIAGAIASRHRLLGVAPAARIIAIRTFSGTASNAQATTYQILRGLEYAIASSARVINMSFAGPRDVMMERLLEIAHEKGVVLVAAAGNNGPESPPLYPAADPNVIAVTATDYSDRPFALSNRGEYICVAAPGVDVLVPAPGGAYGFLTGTSIAAAHVSGVAALMIEGKPAITPAEVQAILMRTAKRLGSIDADQCRGGTGLINADAALLALTDSERDHPTAHFPGASTTGGEARSLLAPAK